MKKTFPLIVLLCIVRQIAQAQSMPAKFLAISDIHLNLDSNQAQSANRDAGIDTWRAAREKILRLSNDPHDRFRFIIYLGDLPMHNLPAGDSIGRCAGQVLTALRQLSQECKVPLLFVPGNNDSDSGDYRPFSATIFQQDAGGTDSWPMPGAGPCDQPGMPCIVPGSTDNLSLLGCYAAYPLGVRGHLRVVVLNSVLFDVQHKGYNDRPGMYVRELSWLGIQLRQAARLNEQVLISMHIPPGFDTYKGVPFWDSSAYVNGTSVQNNFLDTLAKYKGIVMGVLSSHTHLDGFKKLYDAKGFCSSMLISVPAIAPSNFNSTSMKLIGYDKHLRITRWTTYYRKLKDTAWRTYDFGTGDRPLIDRVRQMDSATVLSEVTKMCYGQENKPAPIKFDVEVKRK